MQIATCTYHERSLQVAAPTDNSHFQHILDNLLRYIAYLYFSIAGYILHAETIIMMHNTIHDGA